MFVNGIHFQEYAKLENTVACSGAFRRAAKDCSVIDAMPATHTPSVLRNTKGKCLETWKAPKVRMKSLMPNYANAA